MQSAQPLVPCAQVEEDLQRRQRYSAELRAQIEVKEQQRRREVEQARQQPPLTSLPLQPPADVPAPNQVASFAAANARNLPPCASQPVQHPDEQPLWQADPVLLSHGPGTLVHPPPALPASVGMDEERRRQRDIAKKLDYRRELDQQMMQNQQRQTASVEGRVQPPGAAVQLDDKQGWVAAPAVEPERGGRHHAQPYTPARETHSEPAPPPRQAPLPVSHTRVYRQTSSSLMELDEETLERARRSKALKEALDEQIAARKAAKEEEAAR